MESILTDYNINLNLLIKEPTHYQKYVFSQWNKYILDRYSEDDFSNSDLFKKHLKYLFPFQFLITSPFYLPDIIKAIDIIRNYYLTKDSGKILIYGDRDADGVCSASMLLLFLRDKLGIPSNNFVVMVPDEEDKYGLTPEVISRLIGEDPAIVFTVDNGSSNKDSFELLKNSNPDVKIIIIDHHSLPKKIEDYPQVDAFINPVIFPEKNSLRNMCTSGLVYLFIQALTYSLTSEYNKVYLLRGEEDIFVKNGIPTVNSPYEKIFFFNNSSSEGEDFTAMWNLERKKNFRFSKVADFLEKNPDAAGITERFQIFNLMKMPKILYTMEQFLPLAAIGTIADSMLLTDDNRILVSEGLSVINNNKSSLFYGLKEVFKAVDLYNNKISEQDMAFSVCPLVNAAGRMGQASIALKTFISSELLECSQNAFLLKEQNEKRKELSLASIGLLEGSLNDNPEKKIIVAYHEDVHRGISGLLASKLAEKYEKPAMVLVNDGDYLRGSVRSYQNENVLSIIHELAPWFVQYGGHLQAAGFSLEHHKKDEFIESVHKVSVRFFGESIETEKPADLSPVIEISDFEITPSLWKELLIFAPFGPGNLRPRLLISLTNPVAYKYLGKNKNHLKLSLSGIKYPSIETVWFFFSKDIEKLARHEEIKIFAEPQLNYFRGGEKLQLRITQIQSI
jgi:single-stranded-DNA-specific exonuclease